MTCPYCSRDRKSGRLAPGTIHERLRDARQYVSMHLARAAYYEAEVRRLEEQARHDLAVAVEDAEARRANACDLCLERGVSLIAVDGDRRVCALCFKACMGKRP